jgi:hypothetical protein
MVLAPEQIGRVIDLAEFLARRGRFEESDQCFGLAGRMNPTSPRLMFAFASANVHSGRNLNEAKRLLSNYLVSPITPDDPPLSEAARLVKVARGD